MCNKRIRTELAKKYNPLNAFGNEDLLKLMEKLEAPDKDGYFNAQGFISDEEDDELSDACITFVCKECGYWNGVNIDYLESEGNRVDCEYCGQKHIVNI